MLYEVQITHCPRDEVDRISEALEEKSALSITWTDLFDDPIFEPKPGEIPLWPHVVITALFDDLTLAQDAMSAYSSLTCRLTPLEAQEWEKTCVADFKAQCFGEHLWICPSWDTVEDPHAKVVTLDPGLAFGTGTHPTTALCLRYLAHADLAHRTLIDYGCGSGILSLAALKLGAQHVQAVDLDPQALLATADNAKNNHITNEQLCMFLPDHPLQAVDLIIANILLTPLIALKTVFYDRLKPQGRLVVSGLLKEQIPILQAAYEGHFVVIDTQVEGDWALMIFENNSIK